MENVNSEDYVGVSPREVRVNQRLQGGLIPTYEGLWLSVVLIGQARGPAPTQWILLYG